MPSLAELLQLQNNSDGYVGYPQLQRQAARMRQSQAGRIPENLQDPRSYGFVRGMLGSTPDELGMSVLSPNTAKAKEAAYYGNQLSNLAQIASVGSPALKSAGKLALVEDSAAMKLAQQRASLPASENGLGLPKNNTAADRARAMGFDTDVYHGTTSPNIQRFDTSLSGNKSGNPFDDYVFSTTSPENASGYSLNWKSYKNYVEQLPEFRSLQEQRNEILKQVAEAAGKGEHYKIVQLRKELNSINENQQKFYDDFMSGKYVSEGATVYPMKVRSQDFMPYEAEGKNWMRANRPAIEESQRQGYEGVAIKNVKDNAGKGLDVIADTYASNNPDLFRFRNAAFDPWRKTAAIASAMGVAAPDLMAKERKK
jgi:hypothetical protein